MYMVERLKANFDIFHYYIVFIYNKWYSFITINTFCFFCVLLNRIYYKIKKYSKVHSIIQSFVINCISCFYVLFFDWKHVFFSVDWKWLKVIESENKISCLQSLMRWYIDCYNTYFELIEWLKVNFNIFHRDIVFIYYT